MTVRIEKNGSVWTMIHDRPEARNAMDPVSADALTAAFLEFDADKNASVAVFYGAGGAFCAKDYADGRTPDADRAGLGASYATGWRPRSRPPTKPSVRSC